MASSLLSDLVSLSSLWFLELLNKSLKAADNMIADEDNLGLNIAQHLNFVDIDIASIVTAIEQKKMQSVLLSDVV